MHGSLLTHSETIDQTTNNHLWKMVGEDLQDCADHIGGESDEIRTPPPQMIARCKSEETSYKCTKLFHFSVHHGRLCLRKRHTEKQLDVMPLTFAFLVSGN